jgi:mono/diheme cytochrome c family protein
MGFLRHPFGQVVTILVAAWLLIVFGIPYLPPLVGVESAPVPGSVVFQYMLTALVGALLWVSDNEERWARFKEPIHRTLVDDERKLLRAALWVLIPVLVAFVTWGRVKPDVSAPPSFRAIHPAPPGQITFRGQTMELSGLENPLRTEGSLEAHYEEGKRVYYQNCLACHGDALDGAGHYAHGFNPAPLNFQDVGTIAQLTESFVFWRIAKGGPGLPAEGTPWNSAMPAWEDFLTEDEIWSVIIFLYEQAGHSPRTWEEEGAEGESS